MEPSGALCVIPSRSGIGEEFAVRPDLEGPSRIEFDGANQGVFPGDIRPIGAFGPFRWRRGGFHFVRIVEEKTGLEWLSKPWGPKSSAT